ncbi:hypothetical protein [Streptomyces sp. NPDC020742]|uniref:hypothetical protein n=1 Tax=Streptomyces sp. NPDC020742 TaxID=3154897 RepID=UPI0033E87BF9
MSAGQAGAVAAGPQTTAARPATRPSRGVAPTMDHRIEDLPLTKLRRLLERRAVPLLEIPEIPGNAPYYRTFWQPASQVAVSVVGTYGEYSTPDKLRVGDVHALHARMTVDEVERRRSVSERQAGSVRTP